MGLFAADDDWYPACGRCPVALACHTGSLKQFSLCPKCGKFQVVRNEFTGGAEAIVLHDRSLYIECPARIVDEDRYIDWAMQGDEDATRGVARKEYDDLSRQEYNDIAALQARILVPDDGPGQKSQLLGDVFMLPIVVCSPCYKKARKILEE